MTKRALHIYARTYVWVRILSVYTFLISSIRAKEVTCIVHSLGLVRTGQPSQNSRTSEREVTLHVTYCSGPQSTWTSQTIEMKKIFLNSGDQYRVDFYDAKQGHENHSRSKYLLVSI